MLTIGSVFSGAWRFSILQKMFLCSFRRHRDSTTSSNLTGLYMAVDIVKMWKFWGRYLEKIGESEVDISSNGQVRRIVSTCNILLERKI